MKASLKCNYCKLNIFVIRLHWLSDYTRLNVGNERYRGNGMSVFRDKFGLAFRNRRVNERERSRLSWRTEINCA